MSQSVMRLKEFRISGLFGIFDHTIPFLGEEKINIVHAPNGYGKTAILRLINAFSKVRFSVIQSIPFSYLELDFDSNGVIRVIQVPTDEKTVASKRVYRGSSRNALRKITIKLIKNEKEVETWERGLDGKNDEELANRIDPFIPATRIGSTSWRTFEGQNVLTIDDVLDLYGEKIPPGIPTSRAPVWLKNICERFPVHFIETQRLLKVQTTKDSRPYSAQESQMVPVVRTYAKDLAERIKSALADYAAFSQSLDRTFPNRVLENEKIQPLKEQEIFSRLSEIQNARERLETIGLLDKESESLSERNSLGRTARRLLSVYVEDIRKKLARFDSFRDRIEAFTSIVNSHFKFKRISVNRVDGFLFRDYVGSAINLDWLSSGEQHELILAYELLFRTGEGALVMIDEPEISLHLEWQFDFLKDLDRILRTNNCYALVCTHSPQIVNDRSHLMITLTAPADLIRSYEFNQAKNVTDR
jgi:predicted ATP-binding protein involved in virulence